MTKISRHPAAAEELTFLAAVYPEVPDGMRLLLWTLPDKRCTWCSTVKDAAASAARMRDERDVYVGVGLRRADLEPGKRGGSDDVVAIPGFACDLDIAGPGHRKPNLCETREQVQELLDTMPYRPTLTVHTGGGVHAWWLFHELWVFENATERVTASEMAKGWSDLLRKEAGKRLRDVDAVPDLARVLRVAGTFNHKNGGRAPVRLEAIEERRYNPSEFEMFCAEVLANVRAGLGAVKLHDHASPPFDRFEALASIEPKFRLSWQRRRKDLSDQSASSYDMSLASFAVQAGWTDQEVVDLLIASRRKHGDDLKLREDYYARTVGKARQTHGAVVAGDELEIELSQAPIAVTPEVESRELNAETREKALQALRTLTGVPVERIRCYGQPKGQYSLVLTNGAHVSMGGTEEFLKFQTWWDRAFELGTAPSRRPKGDEWLRAMSFTQALIDKYDSEEVAELEVVKGQLRLYAASSVDLTGASSESRASIIDQGLPFTDGGALHVQLERFRQWLLMQREKVERPRLFQLFKIAGFTSAKLVVRSGDRLINRHYWRVPREATD